MSFNSIRLDTSNEHGEVYIGEAKKDSRGCQWLFASRGIGGAMYHWTDYEGGCIKKWDSI